MNVNWAQGDEANLPEDDFSKFRMGEGFFCMTFQNGWTVSIPLNLGRSAELGAWNKDGIWTSFGQPDNITPEHAVTFLNMIKERI